MRLVCVADAPFITTFVMPTVPHRFAWNVLLVFAVLTVFTGWAQKFSVHGEQLLPLVVLIIAMIGLSVVYTGARPNVSTAMALAVTALFIAGLLVMGLLSYFVAAFGYPLVDAPLTRIELALGFDWVALQRATASSPFLSKAACWIYGTSGLQLVLGCAILAVIGEKARLSRLLTALVLATGTVVIISGFVPAIGAYEFYGITEAERGFLKGTGAGVSYIEHFRAVRDGSLRVIDLKATDGIVQFPSFHTVVAVLSAWQLWRVRWLSLPNAAYSGVVILTTLPIGGHHLIDLFAGAVVTAACLAIAALVERSTSAPQSETEPDPGFVWQSA